MTSRFYIKGNLDIGAELVLPDEVAHHFYNVLRLREGARIILFNGEPRECEAVAISANRKEVRVNITRANEVTRENPRRIHLGLCALKRDAMTSALAKVTEVGVREITPVISEHCAVSGKSIAAREPHWRKAIIAACEQCGLNTIPALHEPRPLADWLRGDRAAARYIALPDAGAQTPGESGRIDLLTGPEGGFAASEEAAALEAGFAPLGLGERILRAETAPVVAIAVLGL